ncbi:excinuclease ABC subunit UvrA [Candidatus Gottesmanbacteria bacterium]|nr:excinuclease ABC subunit UvrA [Candidatus Gottesmanbacteria bacterium]
MEDKIIIRGARQHNLKNIDVEIPKNKLVVFTGLSGSGKSSLAFDTIYAEGQRRYVESLSSYARQFLGVMDKPDVDSIDGLSPAISIDQKSTSHNPRSTVGTITEIYDYLRLLFARIGHPHCPNCGTEISKQSIEQITSNTIQLIKKFTDDLGRKPVRLLILSPIVLDRKGEFRDLFANLRSKGFTKVRIDGNVIGLDEELTLIKTNKHTIEVVIDRISCDRGKLNNKQEQLKLRSRLNDAIEQSTAISEGLVIISKVSDASFDFPDKPQNMTDHLFSERFSCPKCNLSMPEVEPRLFSFNSPHGACPKCSGIGTLLKVDPDMIINPSLSITEGAILPFARLILSDSWYGRVLLTSVKKIGIASDKPLKGITAQKRQKLLYGTGNEIYEVSGTNRYGKIVTIYEEFKGVIPELEKRYSETESEYVRSEIGKYMKQEICPACLGKRLKAEALSIIIDSLTIVDIAQFSISKALQWHEELWGKLDAREKTIANLIIREIKNRLSFLISVGLNYLSLDRSANTLAGGEAQRIRLASQIGSGLSGVLYVLDEPSIGLHPKDNNKLIATLMKLRNLGNSVIVVEHDREMIESSDFIYDFGPAAGTHGGKIIASGTLDEIKKNPQSITGRYLSNKKIISIAQKNIIGKVDVDNCLTIHDACENNLKKLTASFPLKHFICVTGVSGSGKSTLVVDTIFHAVASFFNPYHREKGGKFSTIVGIEKLKRVVLIDQSPIGRTPRSNPATYTGAFTFVRDLFSQMPEAKMKGYGPGRFSFNVKGGRCEVCEGEGQTKIEMQFLPDVYVTCDVCRGTRYNAETLEVTYKGKNIAEVLQMTVEEGLKFFGKIPSLYTKLETLHEVGLSYIHLGQPAPQLSGGEAQRVKLSSELSKKGTNNTLYILDEPTTGLHFADLEKLILVLRQLVNMGNTVIVIEHNLDVIKNADWIIDLGPEGGDGGGYILSSGTPLEIAENDKSHTGQFLAKVI